MPSEEGKDDAGFSGCTDEQNKGKGNMTPSPRIDAQPSPRPQQDDSSNSDMRELKMMLGGGISDRSGNVLFSGNQGEDVIFSDEGSDDSFARDEDFEAEEEE